MKTSEQGINMIKEFEKYSDVAYPDPGTGGTPFTIGWGHTFRVKPDQRCDRLQADYWLRHQDVPVAEQAVSRYVKVPLKQNQFDALVSFVFNLGVRDLKSSTLLKKLNARDYAGAAKEFERWIYANHKILPGLVRRRKKEADVFLNGY